MKFLVMQQRVVGVNWPEDSYSLWKATREWLNGLAENKQLETLYWIPGQGPVAILNVNTHEELALVLQDNPMKPMGSYAIFPLSSASQFTDRMLQMTGRM